MYPGAHAQKAPDQAAVIMAGSGRVVTYRQLDDNSAALASALHGLGLRRGDVVAMLSDNAAECFEIYWAAIRSGLYITAVNRYLAPDEVAYIVQDSDARALIASAGLRELAGKSALRLPEVTHRFAFGGAVEGFASYEELIAGAGPRLTDQPRGSDMLYSSGTTGRPKGVRPPLPALQVDEPGDPITGLLDQAFNVGPDDVYLSPAPIYHAAPLKWSAAVLSLGGTVVMMEKFDAEAALAAIEKYGVTICQMVPTMFVRLLQLPDEVRARYDHGMLRLAVHAAAPCPPEVKEAMIAWWGPILLEYYGSTEQHGITLISTPEWLTKRGSVGRAAIGVAHICDDDGRELPPGEVGSVYFERETRPFEYHKDPEKTKAAEHPEHPNWTTVGDLGYLDEDGYLFLTDRKSFVIISGGVNIYPQEVENVLTLHDKIFDVAVIGVPDPEMGQSVTAFVQLKPGVEPSGDLEREIIDYVRGRIAHFKAPRSVTFVGQLPRLATGKLVKRELAARYAASTKGGVSETGARAYDPLSISPLSFWAGTAEEREETFRVLRAERPLSWHPPLEGALVPPENDGVWVATTHELITEISKSPDRFCSSEGFQFEEIPPDVNEAAGSFLGMDAPRHVALRKLVSAAFTPRQVAKIHDQIRNQARIIVDDLLKTREGDFVQQVSKRLPMWTIYEMLGLEDPAVREEAAHHADGMVSWADEQVAAGREPGEVLNESLVGLLTMGFAFAEERRAHPRSDLMTNLVNAEVDGQRLTDEEIASFFVLLSVAGNDTTRNSISITAKAFQDFPDQRGLLLADFEGRIRPAIEEFVRWASPVMTFRRTATRDTVLGGQEIKKGEWVAMVYSSGNRDEKVFDRPHEFDITRQKNPHVGFGGGGPHFCMGNFVAKMQLREIFDQLLHRAPTMELGEPEYLVGNFVHAVTSMPYRIR